MSPESQFGLVQRQENFHSSLRRYTEIMNDFTMKVGVLSKEEDLLSRLAFSNEIPQIRFTQLNVRAYFLVREVLRLN
jgi:hypothetical protein